MLPIGRQIARYLRPSAYAFLLDQAATTGFVPRLDQFGRPVPTDTGDMLPPQDRLKTLQYLLDKVLPAAKAVEQHSPLDPLLAATPGEVDRLTSAELVTLANGPDDGQEADTIEAEFMAAGPRVPTDPACVYGLGQ